MSEYLYCSFCQARHPDEVTHLVAAPGVYICKDCAVRCLELFAEASAKNTHLQQPTNPSE